MWNWLVGGQFTRLEELALLVIALAIEKWLDAR